MFYKQDCVMKLHSRLKMYKKEPMSVNCMEISAMKLAGIRPYSTKDVHLARFVDVFGT